MNPTTSKVSLVEAKGLLVISHLTLDSSHLDNVQQDFSALGFLLFGRVTFPAVVGGSIHTVHLSGVIVSLCTVLSITFFFVRKQQVKTNLMKMVQKFSSIGLSDDVK